MHVTAQGQLAICLDLTKLYNMALFKFGYYQLRLNLTSAHGNGPVNIQCQVPRTKLCHLFPATLVDGKPVSTTVEISFQRELIEMSDQMNYSIQLGNRLDKLPDTLMFTLTFELWHMEKMKANIAKDVHFTQLSSCECVLRIPVRRGLHYSRYVHFDFYNAAGVTFVVHASLMAVKLARKQSKSSISDASSVNDASPKLTISNSLHNKILAYHRTICILLLSAIESLQLKISHFLSLLPNHAAIVRIDSTNSAERLAELQRKVVDADDVWLAFETDVTLLADDLSVLWQQFLQLFRCQSKVQHALAEEHHVQRTRRFADSFLYTEHSMDSALSELNDQESSKSKSRQEINERLIQILQSSPFFKLMADLPVSAHSLDANVESMSIIIEECYSANVSTPSTSNGTRSTNGTESKGGDSKSGQIAKLNGVQRSMTIDTAFDSTTSSSHNTPATVSKSQSTNANESQPTSTNNNRRSAVRSILFSLRHRKSRKSRYQRNNHLLNNEPRLTPMVEPLIMDHTQRREDFKGEKLQELQRCFTLKSEEHSLTSTSSCYLSSNYALPNDGMNMNTSLALSTISLAEICRTSSPSVTHLFVCVHGLDGSGEDMRVYEKYIRLGYPPNDERLEFLLSEGNQGSTLESIDRMADNLVDELVSHFTKYLSLPAKISFIGHSLGNLIIRSAVGNERLRDIRPNLHTYLSLNGPHAGCHYGSSISSLGMRLVRWYTSSESLKELSLVDVQPADLSTHGVLCRMARRSCLGYFNNVLLVGSLNDRFVPIDSALMQSCKAANGSTVFGKVYNDMVKDMLQDIANSEKNTRLIRYTVGHQHVNTARAHLVRQSINNQLKVQVTGRASHLAVIDDDPFVEKLLTVSALKYFAT